MLLAESEGDLQRVASEFCSVCKRRKLKVNAGKSKVMVFERRKGEVIDFNIAYRVRWSVRLATNLQAQVRSWPGQLAHSPSSCSSIPFGLVNKCVPWGDKL